MSAPPSPRKPPLTPSKRGRIQQMIQDGVSYRTIAKRIGCSIGAVAYTQKRWKEHKSHYTLPRSGRPTKYSRRQQRHIIRYVLLKRFSPWRSVAASLNQIGIDISASGVRSICKKAGIRRYSARDRPALTKSAIEKRRKWARSNRTTDWRHIIFTDECSLDTSTLRRRPIVSRLRGGAALPGNTSRSFRSTRKTVMVWAAIAHGKKSPLLRLSGTGMGSVDSKKYIALVINGALRQFVLQCELEELSAYRIVEDNAAIHNSRATNAARAQAGLIRHEHPPLSPDLNPIEKAWRLLKSRLRARCLTSASPDALWAAAQEEWERIDVAHLDKYIDDMPKRVKIVTQRKGLFTE